MSNRRRTRWAGIGRAAAALLAVVLLAAPAVSAKSVRQKKLDAAKQFQRAAELREALNGKPAERRTRDDFTRVVYNYQMVFMKAPTSSKADEAVLAVAELRVEMGRALKQDKFFETAIEQYRFLAREYPGSIHRFGALFTVGEIYRQDLKDQAKAKQAFSDFLATYPHHRLAKEAKLAIQEINNPAKKPAPKAVEAKKQKKPAPQTAQAAPMPPSPPPAEALSLVTSVRHWSTPDYTRIAIDLDEEVKYEAGRVPNPDRIYFDLHNTRLASELVGKTFDVENGFLRKVRIAQFTDSLTRVVLEVDEVAEYSAFLLPNPYRLIVDIHGKQPAVEAAQAKPAAPAGKSARAIAAERAAAEEKESAEDAAASELDTVEIARQKSAEVKATEKPTSSPTFESVAPRKQKPSKRTVAKAAPPAGPPIREAKPTASGERSLIRALGLKIGRIVVDAGHGGHDTGTIGPNGLMEKDLVLDVAMRLGKMLETDLGAEVVLTRDDDTFIPLETRTAVANKEQADLFISIHANSSRDKSARGIETYYLNFTSSPEALEVAARENAVSQKSIFELQDLVKKIAMKEKIEESREFASDVQRALHRSLSAKNPGLRDRGVKKAPFIVLIGANMPSILAEISFVSNPNDERKLQTAEYRQKVAEALHKGIASYVGGLSGIRLAQGARAAGSE